MPAITINSPKTGRTYAVDYYKGDTIADAVELFGEEVVLNKLHSQIDTDLGNAVRALLNKEKTDEEIAAFIDGWKPGVRRVGTGGKKKKDGVKEWAAEYKAEGTTPERKAELKAMIQNYIAEAQALAAAL